MIRLADKLENALNDTRILILGAQVLVGFDYRAVFEERFTELPQYLQTTKEVSLVVQLIALALLISPAPFHHLVEEHRATARMHRFTHRVTEIALLPLAFSLSLDVYVATYLVAPKESVMFGGAVLVVSLVLWYGYLYLRRRLDGAVEDGRQEDEGLELKDKVKQVLIESRMELPGAQALLGFQFVTVLMKRFTELPHEAVMVHLASLMAIALSVVLLISPAAYHRIVCQGEDSEKLVTYAGRMIMLALVPLSLGMCGDLYVVLRVCGFEIGRSAMIAGGVNVITLGFWFGMRLLREPGIRGTAATPAGPSPR